MTSDDKLTIKDVARMCGVSPQTVSRVLNGRSDVAVATRRLIEETIVRLGFQPSAVARSLVQQRSMTLGFVTAGLDYVGASQIVAGISTRCEQLGYGLLMRNLIGRSPSDLASSINALMARHVEGIIVQMPMFDPDDRGSIAWLSPRHPPIVVLKGSDDDRYSTITVDNVRGARDATAHLLSIGRRRIAHLAGPPEWGETRQRREGWELALHAAGVEADPRGVQHGDWTPRSGIEAFEALLRDMPDLDGLLAANDQMALGALHVCHARGIRVPQDVAVIGFDGIPEGEAFSPSLTTMRQPLVDLGELAVEEIVARIASERPVQHLVLGLELIRRDSA